MRTKLADRILPNYKQGEEIFNSVSHIVGAGISVVVLITCVVIAAMHGSIAGVITSIIYGLSSILLYTMSSIYHGLPKSTAKKVMQILDHCAIYFLIAGTYTPIVVVKIIPVYPTLGWGLLALEWGLAIVAIIFTAIDVKKYQIFSMLCNLVMGWAIIVYANVLLEVVGIHGFILILGGGIFYTIGAILYAIGHKQTYMHCVFHIFVLLGSITHAFAIIFYVL